MKFKDFGKISILRSDRSSSRVFSSHGAILKCDKCGKEKLGVAFSREFSDCEIAMNGNQETVQRFFDSVNINCDCDRARCRIGAGVQRQYRGRFTERRYAS